MSEKKRAPGGYKIDVLVSVLIREIGPLGFPDKNGGPPYCLKCPDRGIHTPGQYIMGGAKERAASLVSHVIF